MGVQETVLRPSTYLLKALEIPQAGEAFRYLSVAMAGYVSEQVDLRIITAKRK